VRLEAPIYIDNGLIVALLLSIVLNRARRRRARANDPRCVTREVRCPAALGRLSGADVPTLRQDLDVKKRGTRGKREQLAREELDAEFEQLRGELRKQTAVARGRRDDIAAAKRATSEAERRARKEGEAGLTALQSKVKAELERLQYQLGAARKEAKGAAESELARVRTQLVDGCRRAEDGAVSAAGRRLPPAAKNRARGQALA